MKSKVITIGCVLAVSLVFAAGCRGPSKGDAFKPKKVPGPGTTVAYYWAGDEFILGKQPTDFGFADLKQAGIKTVLNLRKDSELPGMDERKSVEALGLRYASVPVDKAALSDAKVDEFLAAVEGAEKPIAIHCQSGNRAAGFWAIYLSMKEDVPGDESVKLADEAGLQTGVVRDFVVDYLVRKGKLAKDAIPAAPFLAPPPALPPGVTAGGKNLEDIPKEAQAKEPPPEEAKPKPEEKPESKETTKGGSKEESKEETKAAPKD